MNILIYVPGKEKPIIYDDASFSVGCQIQIERFIPYPVQGNGKAMLTEFFDTGQLWVFRIRETGEGTERKAVRDNIAVFARGEWTRAEGVEPPVAPRDKMKARPTGGKPN